MHKTLAVEYIFDTRTVKQSTLAAYLDKLIEIFRKRNSVEEICEALQFIIEKLSELARQFCVYIGNSIVMRDFIELADKYPAIDAIIHTHYDEHLSSSYVEKNIKERTETFLSIINQDRFSNIRPFLMAEGSINIGQFAQCVCSVGYRSDIYGNVTQSIVNTNYLRGFKSVMDYYIESFAGLKALINNRFSMGDSGYMSRVMNLSSINLTFSDTVHDCNTRHLLTITVRNKEMLSMLRYKNMVIGSNPDGTYQYREINPNHDGNLIGTTIQIRSHIFCALERGTICDVCYGELRFCIKDTYHPGLIAAATISAPTSQNVLSSKHLMKTVSKVIKWCDHILEFFTCSGDTLYLQDHVCRESCYLGFFMSDIEEYMNIWNTKILDESEIGDKIINKFTLIVGEQSYYFDNIGADIYLDKGFLNKFLSSDTRTKTSWESHHEKIQDTSMVFIPLERYTSKDIVFNINIENNEMSVYLGDLMKIIGVRNNTGYESVNEFIDALLGIVFNIGLSERINFAHIESITYNLVRDKDDLFALPDFSSPTMPPYTIVSMREAITKSPDITTSLSYERIGEQLARYTTYAKHKKGFLDPFFW
jgi:hypothetical protein